MSEKVVVVVQARLGSTRLPGKVLLDLGGKPVIERVVERCRRIPGVAEVVLAVPEGPADAPLAEAGRKLGVRVHQGSEDDVLDRFYHAAKAAGADVVVRVTADCPLLDPELSGRVVDLVRSGKADYGCNFFPPCYPDGLDTEAFRFSALEAAWKEARLPIEREHVTPFIRTRPERFRQASIRQDKDLSALRWTLDEPRDLEFLRSLYERLNGRSDTAGLDDIMKILEKEPGLADANAGIVANEGYYKGLLKEPAQPARKIDVSKSTAHLARALERVPGASQTFSKAPNQFVKGVAPLFLRRGKGAHVWDLDGNEFIDTTMSLAPVSLGYADPDVDAAVAAQLQDGTILTQPHPFEVEMAELMAEVVPCAEMTRFAKNGSDATSAAVRLARYKTGRDIVAAGSYHGWHDWYIGTTTRDGGIPAAVKKLTKTFNYNDIESLHKVFKENPGQVACVILEPAGAEGPKDQFLHKVQALCRKEGAVLVFDEVVTGFRFALGGAQELYGVTPDLGCFGKAMANGFPLAALSGKAELMRLYEDVFISGTFGGELLSLAAGLATVRKMRKEPVIAHIWAQGRRLQDGYNVMAKELGLLERTTCVGLPPHTVIPFKREGGEPWWELKSLFQQESVRRGLLFMATHNPCWALSHADVEAVLRAYSAALRACAEAVKEGTVEKRLEGPSVEAIFRKP